MNTLIWQARQWARQLGYTGLIGLGLLVAAYLVQLVQVESLQRSAVEQAAQLSTLSQAAAVSAAAPAPASVNPRQKRLFQRETHVEPIAPKRITDTPPALPPVVIPTPSRIAGFLRNLAMILVSVAAIAVIGFVITNMLQEGQEATLAPTATLGTATITPTDTPSMTPRATEPTQTPDRLALGLVNIQVIVQMEQRSWLRVRVDGQDVYTGVLEPNLIQTYEGSNLVEILASERGSFAYYL